MPLKITFELSDADLEYFRDVFRKAQDKSLEAGRGGHPARGAAPGARDAATASTRSSSRTASSASTR